MTAHTAERRGRHTARRAAYAHVGAAIRHYRKAASMSREALAKRSGYSVSGIQAWEDGRWIPRPVSLRDVAQALKVTKADLLAYRPPRVYRATRVGPHVVGRCYLSGWSWEEVAA